MGCVRTTRGAAAAGRRSRRVVERWGGGIYEISEARGAGLHVRVGIILPIFGAAHFGETPPHRAARSRMERSVNFFLIRRKLLSSVFWKARERERTTEDREKGKYHTHHTLASTESARPPVCANKCGDLFALDPYITTTQTTVYSRKMDASPDPHSSASGSRKVLACFLLLLLCFSPSTSRFCERHILGYTCSARTRLARTARRGGTIASAFFRDTAYR